MPWLLAKTSIAWKFSAHVQRQTCAGKCTFSLLFIEDSCSLARTLTHHLVSPTYRTKAEFHKQRQSRSLLKAARDSCRTLQLSSCRRIFSSRAVPVCAGQKKQPAHHAGLQPSSNCNAYNVELQGRLLDCGSAFPLVQGALVLCRRTSVIAVMIVQAYPALKTGLTC